MTQSVGMAIATMIMTVGAVCLASWSIYLASRENEARHHAGPR